MASKTKKLNIKRAAKNTKAGKKGKRLRRRGTTPPFSIHLEEEK